VDPQKVLKQRMAQYAPVDPYYDEVVGAKGKVKKVKVCPLLYFSQLS